TFSVMVSQRGLQLRARCLAVFCEQTRRCLQERRTRICRTFPGRSRRRQPVRNLQSDRLQDRTLIPTTLIRFHSQSRRRQSCAGSNVTTSSALSVTERPDTATAWLFAAVS